MATQRKAAKAVRGRAERPAGRRRAAATLPASAAQIQRLAQQCRREVTRRALVSAGATLVPLPGFDLAVDVGVLATMLDDVNRAFGLTPAQIDALAPQRQFTVYKAINTLGASAVGRLVTRRLVTLLARSVARRIATKTVLRYVPLAGQAIAASLSFAALKTLGDRHVADCVKVAQAALAKERESRIEDRHRRRAP
jgi:uncharacterized protein (DUF697 family)